MTLRFSAFLCLALLGLGGSVARANTLPVCQQDQLSLGFDSENGAFNGMSHSGTLLVVRNLGPRPCQMPAFPQLMLLDTQGRKLPIVTQSQGKAEPPGMAVGAEATAGLRWVSSPVFTNSKCLRTAHLELIWYGGTLKKTLNVLICGPDAGPTIITQQPLVTDPVLSHR